ncbi:SAP domain-containing protein [Saccharothrix lopnurensis]|uniref:SAP domain-containing protein n=1 Tax=Saccharothrix lopnurensis TaxID=1670621 RepID=A0ABW1P616_9PSEU
MPHQVKLLRRMGQNPAGSIRTYRDSEAEWLVNSGHAEYVGSVTHREPEPPAHTAPEEQGDDQRPPAPDLATLKAQAGALGLPTYGTKAQLADRIEQHKATLEQPDDELEDDLDGDDEDDE